MENYQVSMCKIMQAALELFRRSGYHKTGVRQITDACGVSLGLMNHYYGSKRILGQHALLLLLDFLAEQAPDLRDDPVMHDIVSDRIQIEYLLSGGFRQFYLDVLECDIMFDSMLAHPEEALKTLREKYAFTQGEDYVLLYSRYLPSYLEKILVLGKASGQFRSISYGDIPLLISQTAKEHFVPAEKIVQADVISRQLAKKIVPQIPSMPPEDFIQSYVCHLSLLLK